MIVSFGVFFEILSIIVCIHYLYGEKLRFDRKTIGLILTDLMLMQGIYYAGINRAFSILIYPIIVLYCITKFGFEWRALLVNNILYLLMIGCCQLGVTLLLKVWFDISVISEKWILIINILIFTIHITVLKKCKFNLLSEFLQKKGRIIGIAFSIGVIILLLYLLRYKLSSSFDLFSYTILLICVVVICVTTASIGKYKFKVGEAETELRMYKLYEKSFLNLIDNIRARQHEFDNHINAIYSQHLLYHTYEELVEAQKNYCDELIKENKYSKLPISGNPMMIGFLYGKFMEAEKHQIEVIYHIAVKELDCGVPVHKLVEILGNLINNAIEALLHTESAAKRLLVEIRETDHEVKIEVGNECPFVSYDEISRFFEKGYSRKAKNRGYGLYNVKRICSTYGMKLACMNREIEEGDDGNFLIFRILKEKKPLVRL